MMMRQAVKCTRNVCRWTQKRHARVVNAHLRSLQSQSPIDRYREKLEEKAKRNIDELKNAYKSQIEMMKSETRKVLSPLQQNAGPTASAALNETGQKQVPAKSPVKSLSSYIDLDKILLHDQEEIELIWRARHANNNNKLCAVIPHNTYAHIEQTAKRNPMFVLPLPRGGENVEMHFLQWSFPTEDTTTCIFTHLTEYKLRGEFARPHTTLTHHLDIADKKGVVLMHGEVVADSGIDADQAKWLVMALQKFYCANTDDVETGRKRSSLLNQFSSGAPGFDIAELINEAKKID